MATIELENISKVYADGTPAVDHISLSIRDREFVVLVGPSGCGKTTTLRMIAGLEVISSGTLKINGRVVNEVAPKDRDIAMVFQNYALYPHMNVYKNMAFSLEMRRKELGLTSAMIDQRVRETARSLGLTEVLNRKPKALSGGQRQRVALGRAIVRNPQAFLFDEPLSNLDAKLRVETRAEIKRLHMKLRTTTVYVTHDQEEAMTMGDRIVVMKDGVIQQCDSPLEVYQNPANRFVAGFVGMPPMNFIAGRIGPGSEFIFGNQMLTLPAALVAAARTENAASVVLGVRPEQISPKAEGRFTGSGNVIKGVVQVIEPLGDRVDIHFRAGEQLTLICRTETHRAMGIAPGDAVDFHVAIAQCHLFEDSPAGNNIVLKSGRLDQSTDPGAGRLSA